MNPIIKTALDEARNLLEPEAMTLLAEYGLPVLPFVWQPSSEALLADTALTFPAVLKVVSRDITHKSEVGGVTIGIQDRVQLQAALAAMRTSIDRKAPDARRDGWMLYPMAARGTEIIAGTISDPQFGPCIMVGLGGVFTEVLKDVSFRVIPISDFDGAEMIAELTASAVLDGLRGAPAVDRGALTALLVKLSRLIAKNPHIVECDLNPIVCAGDNPRIVDARMVVSAPSTPNG